MPFSILGGTARVTGVGDILTPMPPCPKCWFTVCMPPQGVSTPRAYSRFDELGTDVKVDGGAAAAALRAGDLDALCAQMANELQYSSESRANAPICAALRRGEGGADDGLRRGSVRRVRDARRRRGRQNGAAAKLAQGVGRAPLCVAGRMYAAGAEGLGGLYGCRAAFWNNIPHDCQHSFAKRKGVFFMFTVTYDFLQRRAGARRLRAARIALCLGTLACILLSQFAAFAQVCAGVRADTLRLHILANSDSEEDQALKLAVRDAILEEYGPPVCTSGYAAGGQSEAAQAHLAEIEQTAARVLAEAGCPQQVHAHMVNMMFHTKEYDGFTLPAGMYDAVRIELGQAAGHNWFCVLFPPLCVPAAADADDGPAYPQEEEEAVSTPYKVKFAALEWWQRLWSGA